LKVAALYDIHGNLPALEAVLGDVEREGHERVVLGGDIAAGPLPVATLDRLRALGDRVVFIRGNADRAGGAAPMDESSQRRRHWVHEKLGAERRRFIEALPATVVLEIDGLGATLFCHGSPRSDEEMINAVTADPRLREILSGVSERVVVCGHTHHQFDRTLDGIRVVNAGSVGLAYEGEPGAYWAVLGPAVEFRRSEYDVEAAAEAIRASGYPDPDEYVELVTALPTAQEAAEFFERQALECT
jgi:putative phosphoesterase